jgi:hypothetical protein
MKWCRSQYPKRSLNKLINIMSDAKKMKMRLHTRLQNVWITRILWKKYAYKNASVEFCLIAKIHIKWPLAALLSNQKFK